jgi:hypothetical protein
VARARSHTFLQGGPRTTRLITTRIDNILPIRTDRQLVDAMGHDEALKLIAGELQWSRPRLKISSSLLLD